MPEKDNKILTYNDGEKLIIKLLVIIMICMFRVIHYCLQMYLKILETCVLRYMN